MEGSKVMMYCHIGSSILEKEIASGRGVTSLLGRYKFIPQLAIHAEPNVCILTCGCSIALRKDGKSLHI